MYALVTGASSGVGKAYATILARDYHHDLILVSNQDREQKQVATELSKQYGVKVIPLYSDLGQQNAAHNLYQWCQDNHIEVDILINNAGMFFWKPLIEIEPKRMLTMLNLHTTTLAMLCRLFGEDMCRRRKGYILNMASMTGHWNIPGIQIYNATKAFVLSFSKSIWYEFRPYGVTVTAIAPGAIDTPLYGLDDCIRSRLVALHISYLPEKLAQIALKRMLQGKKHAMPGWINHIAVPLVKHLPDWVFVIAMRHLPQYKSIPFDEK